MSSPPRSWTPAGHHPVAVYTGRRRSPVERWAPLVAAVALADDDTSSLDEWAELVHLRPGLLVRRCRAAAARPKDSLDFGRLARVLRCGDPQVWCPERWLDIADDRTLTRLLDRGGLECFHHGARPALDALVRGHTFTIPSAGVALIRQILDASRQPPLRRQARERHEPAVPTAVDTAR